MRAVLASPNARLFLGEKTIFSPSFGLLLAVLTQRLQCRAMFYLMQRSLFAFSCLRSPPLAQPPLLSFQYKLCGVASATEFYFATQLRRSPESPNALAEIARQRRNSYVLTPNPPVRTRRSILRSLPRLLNLNNKKGMETIYGFHPWIETVPC